MENANKLIGLLNADQCDLSTEKLCIYRLWSYCPESGLQIWSIDALANLKTAIYAFVFPLWLQDLPPMLLSADKVYLLQVGYLFSVGTSRFKQC